MIVCMVDKRENALALLERLGVENEFDGIELINVEPPAVGGETDENYDDEDNRLGGRRGNWSGRQLQAGAEAVLWNGERFDVQNNEGKYLGNEDTNEANGGGCQTSAGQCTLHCRALCYATGRQIKEYRFRIQVQQCT